MIYIITGGQGEGKTNFLREVTSILKQYAMPLKGFLAAGVFKDNKRTKFVLEDVNSEEKELFCDTTYNNGDIQFGRFAFKRKGREFGTKCLNVKKAKNKSICVIDEIGKLETSGRGWHHIFKTLLKRNSTLIISVGNLYLNEVVSFFEIENFRIFDIADITPAQTAQEIFEASGT